MTETLTLFVAAEYGDTDVDSDLWDTWEQCDGGVPTVSDGRRTTTNRTPSIVKPNRRGPSAEGRTGATAMRARCT